MLASFALFALLCGVVLVAASAGDDSPGDDVTGENVTDTAESGTEASRAAIERALRHLDDAEHVLGENDEPARIFIQRARDALREFVPAPSITNPVTTNPVTTNPGDHI